MITSQHLKNAYTDGVFYLPSHYLFFNKLIATDFDYVCMGDTKEFGSELECKALMLGNSGKALLLCLTDTKGKEWYAWFHADEKVKKKKIDFRQ